VRRLKKVYASSCKVQRTLGFGSVWYDQLNSSGFGLLNGLGFGFFLGLRRGFAFVVPGMGIGLGLHIASPTTSLTRIPDFP
jgi:hypothetical protein